MIIVVSNVSCGYTAGLEGSLTTLFREQSNSKRETPQWVSPLSDPSVGLPSLFECITDGQRL